MTFEELKKVNSEIKTKNIKGKEYAEVPERIQAFRKLFPNGDIDTSIVYFQNGQVVIQATATWEDENGKEHHVTGTAEEKEGSSYINKTSFLENCETSAIGRALGMLGIGSTSSIASAEEVENAINNQQKKTNTPPKPYQKVQDNISFKLWEDQITPIWVELNGKTKESAIQLKEKYKSMKSDEDYQQFYKSLIQERNKRGENSNA